MKLQALAALFAAVGTANAHGLNPRHAHIHKRQDATTSTSSTEAPAATQTTSSSSTDTSTSGPAAPASTSTGTVAAVPTATGSYATLSATVSDVPALSALTFGMPSGPAYTATTTVASGYIPTISGLPDAPAIPGCTSLLLLTTFAPTNTFHSCVQDGRVARARQGTSDWYETGSLCLDLLIDIPLFRFRRGERVVEGTRWHRHS